MKQTIKCLESFLRWIKWPLQCTPHTPLGEVHGTVRPLQKFYINFCFMQLYHLFILFKVRWNVSQYFWEKSVVKLLYVIRLPIHHRLQPVWPFSKPTFSDLRRFSSAHFRSLRSARIGFRIDIVFQMHIIFNLLEIII